MAVSSAVVSRPLARARRPRARLDGDAGVAAARRSRCPGSRPTRCSTGLIGESLWETGTLTVRGLETPYYSLLYPAFVGLPLSLDDAHASDPPRAGAAGARHVARRGAGVPVGSALPLRRSARSRRPSLTLAVPALAYSGPADDGGALLPARRARARSRSPARSRSRRHGGRASS